MAIKKTIFCGNNFIEVDFPDNTRILSAPPHEDVLDDPRKATLEAIRKPIDHRPLKDLVKEGSTVLIAFDDLAVPVPPMAPGTDNRQYVIEVAEQVRQVRAQRVADRHRRDERGPGRHPFSAPLRR